MRKNKSRVFVSVIVCAAFFLLACETANLILGSGGEQVPPTSEPSVEVENPTRSPDDPYDFVPAGTPRCSAGDNSISLVNGQITQDGSPVFGQRVQAASSPGGDPVGDTPVEADENGNFQVTFDCGGSACNGDFWLWVINDSDEQVSPFIQFIFDDQCHVGTVNFSNP